MPRDPFDEFDRFLRKLSREMSKDFERMFEEGDLEDLLDLSSFKGQPRVRGFQLEIRDRGTGEPEVKVRRFGEPSRKIAPAAKVLPLAEKSPEPEVKPPEVKPVKRTLETNVAKVEKLDEVVLTLQAPDVKEEDVEIRQMGETLEVIARKPSGDAYFAIFELPPDADPEERKVEIKDNMLIISVPRHRPFQTKV
jgi:HSP20 family molecular chaperone IbpA